MRIEHATDFSRITDAIAKTIPTSARCSCGSPWEVGCAPDCARMFDDDSRWELASDRAFDALTYDQRERLASGRRLSARERDEAIRIGIAAQ